ncbi:exodeoxyribonuclease VII small subunit [Campylobacter sp. US33a]|uniref:Exodeoxyribonuclease VII small subunit n=1 Tax=Campylobacter sp. CCS1377 TaxID=3158229 RepID=A0AAU7E9G9_9BACT|nr:exodeoxyribonuclease VII small subunit [Campylobacter sp. US33a]MCW1360081.1 exodeoxyribonuclease VII small subunit [Campylobacter jejuni]TEY02382.1 exodeoxyribonuclease VII small subunit [Campylobacter sp. US33a]
MSFEEKLQLANEILEKLNDQNLSLEESVKIYKKGLQSINEARKMLEKAKLEIEPQND